MGNYTIVYMNLLVRVSGFQSLAHLSLTFMLPCPRFIAEDSFILLDALEQDAQGLIDLQPTICLEIG